jgi:hypothetical protein
VCLHYNVFFRAAQVGTANIARNFLRAGKKPDAMPENRALRMEKHDCGKNLC